MNYKEHYIVQMNDNLLHTDIVIELCEVYLHHVYQKPSNTV